MLPGKAPDVGVSAKNNRLFVEAVLWIARIGAPWRDLPNSTGRSIASGEAESKGGATASYRQF
jgi:transposase